MSSPRCSASPKENITDGWEPKTIEALTRYSWPGNVRELQNVLRNIVLFNDGPIATTAMLPRLDPQVAPRLVGNGSGLETPQLAGETGRNVAVKPLWQVERTAIEEALALCGGNVPRAAAILEVNPSTIYRRKAEWDKGRLASSA